PLAIPLLFLIGWLARPNTLRRARIVGLVAGTVLGAFWYAVNLVETSTWDGHVSEEFHVDRSPAAVIARIVRLLIEFIEVPGASGRDRWLYAVVGLIVVVVAGLLFTRSRRT